MLFNSRSEYTTRTACTSNVSSNTKSVTKRKRKTNISAKIRDKSVKYATHNWADVRKNISKRVKQKCSKKPEARTKSLNSNIRNKKARYISKAPSKVPNEPRVYNVTPFYVTKQKHQMDFKRIGVVYTFPKILTYKCLSLQFSQGLIFKTFSDFDTLEEKLKPKWSTRDYWTNLDYFDTPELDQGIQSKSNDNCRSRLFSNESTTAINELEIVLSLNSDSEIFYAVNSEWYKKWWDYLNIEFTPIDALDKIKLQSKLSNRIQQHEAWSNPTKIMDSSESR